jgi:hypothetical protein
VLYLRLIILSVRDNIPIDSETLLVTDFVNLKIKPTQSFKVVYRVRIYTRILIEMSAHRLSLFTVFLKKTNASHCPNTLWVELRLRKHKGLIRRGGPTRNIKRGSLSPSL